MNIEKLITDSPDFFLNLFNAVPSMVFVVDADRKILHWNPAGAKLVNSEDNLAFLKHHGEAINCINSIEGPGICGDSTSCKDCVIKNSIEESSKGKKVFKKITTLTLKEGSETIDKQFILSAVPFKSQNSLLTLLIMEDITEMVQLRSLMPICAWCKKMRNDKNYWETVEEYMGAHFDTEFTHGICPDCLREHNPEIHNQIFGKKSEAGNLAP
jgi:hypothetical protein